MNIYGKMLEVMHLKSDHRGPGLMRGPIVIIKVKFIGKGPNPMMFFPGKTKS